LFNGAIQSSGPRYCPSIEDKINRFADKTSHQLFVEPEGWNTVEMYIMDSLRAYRKKFSMRLCVEFQDLKT